MRTLALSFAAATLLAQAPAPVQLPAPAPPPAPAPSAAQAPSFAKSLNQGLKGVEVWSTGAAEAMPEDKYHWAPTQGAFAGVRTFAQQVKHMASVNILIAAAILEEKPALDPGGQDGPDALKTKAEIVKYLQDSFTYLHRALDSVTEANVLGMVKSPFGKGQGTRLGYANLAQGHGFDHYGQMVVYLRLNGIVPPASLR